MARSALRRSCSQLVPGVARAMPMLTLADTSVPSIVKVRLKELTIRWATAITSCSVAGSSRITANSSPPRRAAVSVGTEAALEALGDGDEQEVAGRVAEAVVDRLEVVEVDEEHGEVAVRAGDPRERVLDPIAEEALVGQVGERVVERLVRELILEAVAAPSRRGSTTRGRRSRRRSGAASSIDRTPARHGSGARRGSRPQGARRGRRSC